MVHGSVIGMFRLFAGRIYTGFKPVRVVESIVVGFGHVVYAGSEEGAKGLCRVLGCDVVYVGVALPGFVDGHLHFDQIAMSVNVADLRGVGSVEEVKAVLRDFGRRLGGWVVARGWDQDKLVERRFITRQDIDEVFKDVPAILIRICGHMAVLNSRAVEILRSRGIDVDRYGDSEKGFVYEDGVDIVRRFIEENIDFSEYRSMFLESQRAVVSKGVTAAATMSLSTKLLPVLLAMDASRDLKIRLYIYLDREVVDRDMYRYVYRGMGIDRARVMGVKLFADGSLGARTALLSKPYSDDPSTSGVEVMKSEEIAKILNTVGDSLDVAIHAIGDRALDNILNTLTPSTRARIRIEHASVVRDDQLERLRGLRISIQPHFVLSDTWVLQRLGEERIRWVYRFRDFIKAGAVLSISTDSPVEPVDPWETIYAAVSRGCFEDLDICRYTDDQRLTIEEALHLYTAGGAAVVGDPKLGCLEPGCYGDLIEVDRDPLKIAENELRLVKVLRVFIAGERVV